MTHDEALIALGLQPGGPGYSPEEVRRAYARAVKADHPDHGGAGTRLALLKKARDALLCHREIPPCKLCRGVGYTRSRFGAQRCTACEGSGDQQ